MSRPMTPRPTRAGSRRSGRPSGRIRRSCCVHTVHPAAPGHGHEGRSDSRGICLVAGRAWRGSAIRTTRSPRLQRRGDRQQLQQQRALMPVLCWASLALVDDGHKCARRRRPHRSRPASSAPAWDRPALEADRAARSRRWCPRGSTPQPRQRVPIDAVNRVADTATQPCTWPGDARNSGRLPGGGSTRGQQQTASSGALPRPRHERDRCLPVVDVGVRRHDRPAERRRGPRDRMRIGGKQRRRLCEGQQNTDGHRLTTGVPSSTTARPRRTTARGMGTRTAGPS